MLFLFVFTITVVEKSEAQSKKNIVRFINFNMQDIVIVIFNPNPSTKKYFSSNQRLYKGTWDKTWWSHALNPHIPTDSLRFSCLSSVFCIYGTRACGARVPGSKSGQNIVIFFLSFCRLSLIRLFLPTEKHIGT